MRRRMNGYTRVYWACSSCCRKEKRNEQSMRSANAYWEIINYIFLRLRMSLTRCGQSIDRKTNRKTTKLRIFCFITRYWLLNAIWCHGSSGNSISIQTHFYCSKEHLVRTSPWPPLCLSLSISQQIDYKQNKYAFISSNLMCCRATAKAI